MPNDVQSAIVNTPKPEALTQSSRSACSPATRSAQARSSTRSRGTDGPSRRCWRDGAHPRALHARAVSPAHGRRRTALRQQRPLPAQRPRRAAPGAMISPELQLLPLAQTIWYIPTGLDIWNQLIGRRRATTRALRPARRRNRSASGALGRPGAGAARRAPFDEGLTEWLTLVQRGEVLRPTVCSSACCRTCRTPALAGAAGLCRADRRAGPHAVQPLLHDRPQVVPRPRHDRARRPASAGTRRTA